MKLDPSKIHSDVAYFRFRKLKDRYILTSETGRFALLSEEQFQAFLEGTISREDDLHRELSEKHFYRTSDYSSRASSSMSQRMDFLNAGPNLHILITTLRCNYGCRYCHASRASMDSTQFDMSKETATKIVERAFESTSPSLNFEFQGGEPLANWDVVKHVIETAESRNKTENRDLAFSLVTNLSLMDEEKMHYLIDHNIYICTSLDGPKELHDANRPLSGGSSYDATVRWMDRIHDEYTRRMFDLDVYHVDALMTTTRQSLPLWKEIIDEYVSRGQKSIHLRPLNPFGFVKKTWDAIGYTADQYMDFYRKSLDYILDLNRQGTQLVERMSAIYLMRMMSDRDPNYMELRSPCGAGIGQVAYNYDGKVFTCDEGRMVSRMGEDLFQMGHIDTDSIAEMVDSEVTKSLIVASTQDALPYCHECAYKPYCGVCPIYNYSTQGDIFGQMPSNERCKMSLWSFDYLFELIAKEDPELERIFERWTTVKFRQLDACDPFGGSRES